MQTIEHTCSSIEKDTQKEMSSVPRWNNSLFYSYPYETKITQSEIHIGTSMYTTIIGLIHEL